MLTLESPESLWEDEFKKELDSLGKSVKPEKQGNIENTGDYIKNYVQNIIEECVAFDPLSLPLNLSYIKESIVNYIVDWKLNSNENGELEAQIKKLSENLMNWKLKYLIDNSYKPLINIIQDIKKEEERIRQNLLNSMPTDKKETIKKWWDKISENMFQQLLIMEGGQWYKAVVHGEFWEKFPTWPYWMVYKHIDKNWNLLKDIAPFKNWERVTKEWALKNAKAYYDKRAQEWKKLLDKNWYEYNQAQLDSLVSASWGTQKSVESLQKFVLSHRNNPTEISNFLSTFATTVKKEWKRVELTWLKIRRKFEANRFNWILKPHSEVEKEWYKIHPIKSKRK